jgi:hypothetical protein
MINLYSSIDVYTAQLRDLESYIKQKPDSASAQFMLAYLYMVQDAKEAAAKRFETVAKLQPADTLSAQLAKALAPSDEHKQVQQTLVADTPPAQPLPPDPAPGVTPAADAQQPEPPAPPATMVGTWVATPDAKVKITLVLNQDGGFSWAVTQDSRTQTIQGKAGFKDEVLVLSQQDGPPLAGKITLDADTRNFSFKPPGSPDKADGLKFTREPG